MAHSKFLHTFIILSTFLSASSICFFSSALLAKASVNTVYIRTDGTIEPSSAPVERFGDQYTLSSNISSSIIIEKDNITVDGAFYFVHGDGNIGVDLSHRLNVTLKNLGVSGFLVGINLNQSEHNTVLGNTLLGNDKCGIYLESSYRNEISWNKVSLGNYGIQLYQSDENSIDANVATSNGIAGIYLDSSRGNSILDNSVKYNEAPFSIDGVHAHGPFGISIRCSPNSNIAGNVVVRNTFGVVVFGGSQSTTVSKNMIYGNTYNFAVYWSVEQFREHSATDFDINVDSSNVVDGRQISYIVNSSDLVLESPASTVYLIGCNNVTLRNLMLTNNSMGVLLWNTNNSRLENIVSTNNFIAGIEMYHCNHVEIVESRLSNNMLNGIDLNSCRDVNITRCAISNNTIWGVKIYDSSDNTLSENSITDNAHGAWTSAGIYLLGSNNVLTANTIANNEVSGIHGGGINTTIFHNNIFDNLTALSSGIIWDNGAEGNYWHNNNYTEHDLDGDGIGDIPYTIIYSDYVGNSNLSEFRTWDSHPLVEPWTQPKTVNLSVLGRDFRISANSTFTIAGFSFNQTKRQLSFNTTGPSYTIGFCSIAVPKELLDSPAGNGSWVITVSGEPTSYDVTLNATHTTFLLTIDQSINQSTRTVNIQGTNPIDTIAPNADAGSDQTIHEEESVTFDGSASKDNVANTSELTYIWTFMDQTPQTLNGMNPSYKFRNVGEYSVELKVTDLRGNWNTSIVKITVLSIPMWLRWWFWAIVFLIPLTLGGSYLILSYITKRSEKTYGKLIKLTRSWVHEKISEEAFREEISILRRKSDEQTRMLIDEYLPSIVSFVRAERATEERQLSIR